MTYYKSTIEILVWAESEAEACDGISESLRPLTRAPDFFFDWRYVSPHAQHYPKPHSGDGFELADGGEYHPSGA